MKTNRERAGDRSSKKALVINQWPGVRSMWDMYIPSIRDDLGEGKYYDQVKKSKYKQSLPAKSGVCVACAGWLKIIRRVLWPSWPSSLACAWQVETQIELMIGPLVDLEVCLPNCSLHLFRAWFQDHYVQFPSQGLLWDSSRFHVTLRRNVTVETKSF